MCLSADTCGKRRKPKKCRHLLALVLLFGAPVDEVGGVENDAEEVGGDKAELGGAEADDANDGAVDSGNDPALPELLSDKHGGENC